jgi:hypothetical protein
MQIGIYLLILAFLIILTTGGFWKDNLMVLFIIPAICFAVAGFIAPMGKLETYTVPATVTRVGNEFVVQSEFPTLLTTSVKFLTATKVSVTRSVRHTIWGYRVYNPTYQIKGSSTTNTTPEK